MVRYIEFTNEKYLSCSSINNLNRMYSYIYIYKIICKGLLEREETAEPHEIVLVRLVYLWMRFSKNFFNIYMQHKRADDVLIIS